MRFADCVRGSLTLTDGAWGTELLRRGGQLTACVDVWNLTHPDRVRQVAESYIRAGSRIILTNTFRANPLSLAHYAVRDQCEAINRAGVQISRQAAGTSAMVFASIGPIGGRPWSKEITHQQLHQAFFQQAQALATEGPDALLIETMTGLDEARVAAAAALETGLPVVVSFVFLSERNRNHASEAVTPAQFASAMAATGAQAIGTNCLDVRQSLDVCKQLAAASRLPIWIKPNAGLPEFIDGVPTYKTTPEEFANSAQELREAGATFLGGCCGTTPEFIRVLAEQPALRCTAACES